MNLLQLILDGVRQRGGVAFWAWLGLMLATWLLVQYSMDREMTRRQLIGAGFVYGVLVLGGATVLARLRTPGEKGEKKASPRKKPRGKGG